MRLAFDAVLLKIDNGKMPATFDDVSSRTLPRRCVGIWTRRQSGPWSLGKIGGAREGKAKLAGMDQRKDRSWTPTLSTSSS